MASVKVFGSPTSTEVARVLASLFEKEVDFQLIRVDTFKGKKRLPDFLKLQPSGQALTFEHGTTTLLDSRAIIRYVAEKFPSKEELLGTGMLERASIEQWLQTEANSFDPPSSALVFNLALPVRARFEPEKQEEIRQDKKQLASVLDIYEQRLLESKYLAGDRFSLADLSHLPNTQRLMNTECAVLFESREKVSKWWNDISSRPAWKRVVAMQKEHSKEPPKEHSKEPPKEA